jgi:hypothetical protein
MHESRRPLADRLYAGSHARNHGRPRLIRQRFATVAVLAACALSGAGLAGCGSHAETKQDYIARANAICESALRGIRNVSPPAGTVTLAGLARYLRQVTPLVESEISQLRALPRPSQGRALLDRYLAALQVDRDHYLALADAARSGDRQMMAEATSALQASPSSGLASQYGLTSCASSSGTAQSS